jgi:propanol-preferring alcohol dehydrogenase
MKAWLLRECGPIENKPMEFVELPLPEPGPRQIRVKVSVCGVCRTDLHIAEGDLPLRRAPLVLGHEIVGVVDSLGEAAVRYRIGDLVGATWLGRTCGTCRFCRAGRENYCSDFQATGWDFDGGFAEYTVVDEDAALPLAGVSLPHAEMAPLMCPGVAGYCAFRLTGAKAGHRLGLYGFGPTAEYVLRVARHLGLEVYVGSRSRRNLDRAERHGAVWAGNALKDGMPVTLDAAVVFPPAGPLVEAALRDLRVGGVLVLAPVAMSTIEIRDYSADLWGRDIRTLYNINRGDALEFLELAGHIDLALGVEVFPFEALPDAMIRAREGRLRQPNAVVRVASV